MSPRSARWPRRACGAALGLAVLVGHGCAKERSVADASGLRVDPTPVVSIGVAEGEAAYELDRVTDALMLADGRIVIANIGSGELRLYDSTGRHLASLGRTGDGPMEFSTMSSGALYATGSQLVAADEGAMRVHLLGTDFAFQETRRFTLYPETPRPYLRGVSASGDWIAMAFANGGTIQGQPGQRLESSYQVLRYDSTGALRDTLLSLPSRPRFVHEFRDRVHFPYVPLSSEPLWTVDGDRLIVVSASAPAMEILSLDGEVIAQNVWDRPRLRSAEIWDAYKAASERTLRGTPDSARYSDFHSKPLPLPEFAPLYQGIKVDDEGRIWLERFRLPGDSTRSWDVLDRDGKLLGAAVTPPGVTVYRVSRGLLLGRSRDSLGVERVQVFRVRTGVE